MFGTPPTFSYDFIADIHKAISDWEDVAPEDRPNDPNCRRGHAVQMTLRSINNTDEAIQDAALRMDSAGKAILAQQAEGLSIYESYADSANRAGQDMRSACVRREADWQFLVALLTEAELAAVREAAAYPRKQEPEGLAPVDTYDRRTRQQGPKNAPYPR
jgi:hypothetical protein